MKRFLLACALLVTPASAFAGILPEVDARKYRGAYTGASDINNAGQLTGLFRVDSPLDDQGFPELPAGFGDSTPSNVDHNIPTFGASGQEVLATMRGLQLAAVFDAVTGGANRFLDVLNNPLALSTYKAGAGDWLFFAPTADFLSLATVGKDGGQFDLILNTSGVGFDPDRADPTGTFGAGSYIEQTTGSGTAKAGGPDPNTASLITGKFQNLTADGINEVLSGSTIVDFTLAGLQNLAGNNPNGLYDAGLARFVFEHVVFAINVTAPVTSAGNLATLVYDSVANIDVTGGSEFGAIKQEALKVQNFEGTWLDTTTDLRFGGAFKEIDHNGNPAPFVSGVGNDDRQDVTGTGSFEFVSNPEPASTILWLGVFGGAALGKRLRRRKSESA